jgi:hypothetical protein
VVANSELASFGRGGAGGREAVLCFKLSFQSGVLMGSLKPFYAIGKFVSMNRFLRRKKVKSIPKSLTKICNLEQVRILSLKTMLPIGHWWLMPVILATWEPRQKVCESLS